jgi:hypothetical protein
VIADSGEDRKAEDHRDGYPDALEGEQRGDGTAPAVLRVLRCEPAVLRRAQ